MKQLAKVTGLLGHLGQLGINPSADPGLTAAAGEFLLEGLYALKKINRSEEDGYQKASKPVWQGEGGDDWRKSRRRMN